MPQQIVPVGGEMPVAPVGAEMPAARATTEPSSSVQAATGDSIIDLASGALKSLGEIALSPARLAAWLAEGQGTPLPTPVTGAITKAETALTPTTGMESAGKFSMDVATSLLPMGVINKTARLAGLTSEQVIARLAANSPKLAKAGKIAGQAVVQGAGQAAIAGAQGGNPIVGGALGALTPMGQTVAPALEQSAEDTMVRALGPSGGRGPTGRVALRDARVQAGELAAKGFGVGRLTQRGALAEAKSALTEAQSAVSDVWAQLPVGANALGATAKMVAAIDKRQAKLLASPNTSQAAYDALEAIKDDIKGLGPNPDLRALKDMRDNWDEVLNYKGLDVASGIQKKATKLGADLVRASINGTSAEMQAANRNYSRAEKLVAILKGSTERPSGGLMQAGIRYGVPGTIGGALGYQEGGYQGMGAGAVSGIFLGQLVGSPAWRYVSAATKHKLATALTGGNQTVIGQVLTDAVAQMSAGGQ
jgi:hypothetical protein